MEKKCVMSLLLVILTNSVITGCGKQEVVPAEEFNAGVVMHESAETEENTTNTEQNTTNDREYSEDHRSRKTHP